MSSINAREMGQNAVRPSANNLQLLREKLDQVMIIKIIEKFIQLIPEHDHSACPVMVESVYSNITPHLPQEFLRVEEGVVVVHPFNFFGPSSLQRDQTRTVSLHQWHEA